MKKLAFKTETIHTVSWSDFEDFVNEFYGITGYHFVSSEEASNDSSHRYSATGELGKWDKKDMKEFVEKNGTPCYRTALVFNDLVAKGQIPAGDYCVEVCW